MFKSTIMFVILFKFGKNEIGRHFLYFSHVTEVTSPFSFDTAKEVSSYPLINGTS